MVSVIFLYCEIIFQCWKDNCRRKNAVNIAKNTPRRPNELLHKVHQPHLDITESSWELRGKLRGTFSSFCDGDLGKQGS